MKTMQSHGPVDAITDSGNSERGMQGHLQEVSALLLHIWVELLVPGAEERVGHIQPLAIQPGAGRQSSRGLPCGPCHRGTQSIAHTSVQAQNRADNPDLTAGMVRAQAIYQSCLFTETGEGEHGLSQQVGAAYESCSICGPPCSSLPCTRGIWGASDTSLGSPPSTCELFAVRQGCCRHC